MKTSSAILTAALASLALAGCSGDGPRFTGIVDPICMPDGTPVWVQYPNSQGSFDGALATRENCPWQAQKSKTDS